MDSAAKKSFGQHWLNDVASLDAICDAAEIKPGDVILEIGPGQGSLTAKLLDRGAQVIAIEADRELLPGLEKRFAGQAFDLRAGDILKFDLGTLPGGYKVVANIPYYLTSKLLRVLCETTNPFSMACLLVQKEVAERVAAVPGNMSLLGTSMQFYCQVGIGPMVPARLFSPPPKVDSQILLLEYVGPKFADVKATDFFRIVKAGFSARRKKLRGSLAAGLGIKPAQADKLLNQAGIDPARRAQTLSLDEWHQLTLSTNRSNLTNT